MPLAALVYEDCCRAGVGGGTIENITLYDFLRSGEENRRTVRKEVSNNLPTIRNGP